MPKDLKKCIDLPQLDRSGESFLKLLVWMLAILEGDQGPNCRGQYTFRVEVDESRSETVVQEITHDF
jgi:hypothetical protein